MTPSGEEFIMEFFIVIAWLVLCGAAAAYASNKGRSGVGIFFLSVFLSPVVGFIVALVMEPHLQKIAEAKGMKKCPECAQFVQPDARTCPFCKKDLEAEMAFYAGEFNPDVLSKKCPDCAETIKIEALLCRFCGHKFQPAEVQATIQQARAEFEAQRTVLTGEQKDKLSRSLCPKCDAYNAWTLQHNSRKCAVCGEEYPIEAFGW
jgi:hypothetical protein